MFRLPLGKKQMTERFEKYRVLVPTVHKKTGAPFLQCLKGLYECKGNIEEAVAWVKKNPGFYLYTQN